MDKTEMVHWGIIGCGDVTEQKSGPAFNKVPNSKLIGCFRRNLSKAEDYAHRHRLQKVYKTADELIHDPEINAVYVATPPSTHANYTIAALKAGKPVYVEKPMARNYAECLSMVEASKKYNVPVYVAYYRRLLPGFLKIKELIDQGAIGKVILVKTELFQNTKSLGQQDALPWRVNPEISGGGLFVDLASHQIDFLNYLFGNPLQVSGFAQNSLNAYPAEDVVTANIQYPNQILFSGIWNFAANQNQEKDVIEICGDNGKIQYGTFNFPALVLENEHGRNEFNFEKPEHVQLNLIQQVVEGILYKNDVVSTSETASETNRAMDIILKNYYSKA